MASWVASATWGFEPRGFLVSALEGKLELPPVFLPLTGKKAGAGRSCLLAASALDKPPPIMLLAAAWVKGVLGYRPTGRSLLDHKSESESELVTSAGSLVAGGVGVLGGRRAVSVDKTGTDGCAGASVSEEPCRRASGGRLPKETWGDPAGRCEGALCIVVVFEPLASLVWAFPEWVPVDVVFAVFRGVQPHSSASPIRWSCCWPPARAKTKA